VVDGYNVYRGFSPGAEGTTPLNPALITGTTFTDTTPLVGEDYYVVKASKSGVLSVASNEVAAAILPAAPTGLTVVASS
jgi:hypothetical protein